MGKGVVAESESSDLISNTNRQKLLSRAERDSMGNYIANTRGQVN